jgi:hypothetical protein
MKEYVQCEFLYVSTHEREDILGSLHCLFGLANNAYCSATKSRKRSISANIQISRKNSGVLK